MQQKNISTQHLWACCGISLLVLGLHAFLAYHPEKLIYDRYALLNRSWGVNHIRFYGMTAAMLFYGVLIFCCVPFINHKLLYSLEKLEERVRSLKRFRYLVFILLGFVASLLFYTFRNRYFLLGDYTLRIPQTMKQDFLTTEYLTMRILYYTATFLSRFQISPTQTFVAVSCVAGGIYISLFAFMADRLGKTRLQKCLLFAGGTASGMLLIFCGYVDIYALPVAFTSLYLYMSVCYIQNRKFFLMALLCLFLAIGSHLLCVAFAPALFIAWYHHNQQKLPFIAGMTTVKCLLLVLALTILTVIIAYELKMGFMLPVKSVPRQPKYMTLWSSKHLWEFLNGQLLGSGISLLILPVLVFKAVKIKLKLSAETWFFLSASAGMLLVVFLANLQRGSGDWDISSLTAITANISVMLLLFQLQQANVSFARYVLIPVLLYNSLNMCLWIHINSGQRSIAKVENMLVNDPGSYYTSRLPGIIQLIYIYQENKLIDDAKRIALKACDFLPKNDSRGCVLYADMIITENKEEEARIFYEALLKKNEYVPQAYSYLIYHYQEHKEAEKVGPLIGRFYYAFKAMPDYFVSQLQPNYCLELITFLYDHNRSANPGADLREMETIIARLKQLAATNPK